MMNNTIYGQTQAQSNGFEFTAAATQQSNFDENYAAIASSFDYVRSDDDTSELAASVTDVKALLAKINPSATKKIKATAEKAFGFTATESEETETKADDKKEDSKEDKKKKSPKIKMKINTEDKTMLTPHTLISYISNLDLEKCADSVFGQIFTDYVGARVHAVDVPSQRGDKRTYVCMELQFALKPDPARDGKIKNVVKIDDVMDFKKATGVTPDVANVMNAFNAQRFIGNQKTNIRINDDTRQIISDFINKNVFINVNGEMVPDWKNLETSATNVGQPTGNNNITNGELIVSVKIDACIFIAKLFKILDIDTSKYRIDLSYFAPCDPTSFVNNGVNLWNVWRGADKLPFLIEVRETDIKEACRVARMTSTGRYGAPVGFMYNRTM